ncbi:ankyrin repeat and EF-hand domain-containing protein 1-like, partial [Sinocyclocheilus grahami]|uniref:ankyrin repeat and EF-hand domain-containing protein 1-like n=1 Tax=Sinocyclocheilus grahami TaxID=75366 RepID=UPI0007AC976E
KETLSYGLQTKGHYVTLFRTGAGERLSFREWESMALSCNANVNNVSNSGKPLLVFSCENAKDCEDLCISILEKGADPNAIDQLVRAILQKGGNPDLLDQEGRCAAHFAAEGGFLEVIPWHSEFAQNLPLFNLQQSNGRKAALKEIKKAEKMHVKLSAPDAGLDKPVENISVENYVSSLQAHQAVVSNENLQRIIMEHDKNRESVINVNYFFKGLKCLQKAFVISSYAPKQAKRGKGGKEKKSGKSASSLPICIMPPEQISIREDSGLPNYMIENYQPFTDTKCFNPDRPPIHPIENDLAWYIDEPEKIYTNINYCVKTGDLESLSLAFTQQVPVDVKDQFFKTPLMTACRCGNYQVAKFL